MTEFDALTGRTINEISHISIYPATHYVVGGERMERALKQIKEDLDREVLQFEQDGKLIEAQRLRERVNYDIEMMREIGFCNGIENYSRYFDGRVSAVIGSHTHVPTNDACILPKGTAYQTDAGMCGDYNSVIGFDPQAPIERLKDKFSPRRLEACTGKGTICGVFIETDDLTGLAIKIEIIKFTQ